MSVRHERGALAWSIGSRAGLGSRRDRAAALVTCISGASLTLAIVVLCGFVVCMLAALGRDYARTPVVGEATPGHAFAQLSIEHIGETWVDILYVDATDGEALELPESLAGLTLEPGEVALSPALEGTAEGDAIVARVGTKSPYTLPRTFLAQDNERYAVARPINGADIRTKDNAVTGYAQLPDWWTLPAGQSGVPLRYQALSDAAITLVILLVLPAVLFHTASSGLGGFERRRRAAQLTVLGASRSERAAHFLGETLPPLGIGSAIVLLAAAPMFIVDVTVPIVDYTIRASDLRAHWFVFALGALVSVIVGLLVAIMATAIGKAPSSSSESVPPIRLWKLLLFPAMVVLAATATLRIFNNLAEVAVVLQSIFLLGIVAALIPFYQAVDVLILRGAQVLGRRTGSAHLTAGSALALDDVRVTTRAGVALSFLTTLLIVVMMWMSVSAQGVTYAASVRKQSGTSVLLVNANGDVLDTVDIRKALPPETELMGMTQVFSEDGSIIDEYYLGSPQILRSVGLDTGKDEAHASERLKGLDLIFSTTLRRARQGDPVEAYLNAPENTTTQLMIASRDGRNLDVETINQQFARLSPTRLTAEQPGQGWAVAARNRAELYRWALVLLPFFLVPLIAAVGLAPLRRTRRIDRRRMVLTILGAGPRLFVVEAIMRLGVPILLACAIGGLAGMELSRPARVPGLDGKMPDGFWVLYIALALGSALACTAIYVVRARSALTRDPLS